MRNLDFIVETQLLNFGPANRILDGFYKSSSVISESMNFEAT